MTEQLAWIYAAADPEPRRDAPGEPPALCPSCRLRPVIWRSRNQEWSRYCGSNTCTNHHRECVWCGKPYAKANPEAGNKYCSDRCKQDGYAAASGNKQTHRATAEKYPCARCGHAFQPVARRKDQICTSCRKAYAGQINRHNMSTEWALRLINATECENCRTRLFGVGSRHSGVVDHDHKCCPGAASCGDCIRGIICAKCNFLAGYADEDPERYAAVLRYIARWQARDAEE